MPPFKYPRDTTVVHIFVKVSAISRTSYGHVRTALLFVMQLSVRNGEFIFVTRPFLSIERTQINARRIIILVVILALAVQGSAIEAALIARLSIVSAAVSMMRVSHDETENNDPLTSRRIPTLRYHL